MERYHDDGELLDTSGDYDEQTGSYSEDDREGYYEGVQLLAPEVVREIRVDGMTTVDDANNLELGGDTSHDAKKLRGEVKERGRQWAEDRGKIAWLMRYVVCVIFNLHVNIGVC